MRPTCRSCLRFGHFSRMQYVDVLLILLIGIGDAWMIRVLIASFDQEVSERIDPCYLRLFSAIHWRIFGCL